MEGEDEAGSRVRTRRVICGGWKRRKGRPFHWEAPGETWSRVAGERR